MKRLTSRLRALERSAGEQPCRACGGRTSPLVVVQFEGEEPRRQPRLCPVCGRSDVRVLKLGPRRWTRPLAHSDTLS